MNWVVGANLGRHARTGIDAHGWLWEITRGAEVAQIVIEFSETVGRAILSISPKTRGTPLRPSHPLRLFRLLVSVYRRSR